jgi:hypothetical protein
MKRRLLNLLTAMSLLLCVAVCVLWVGSRFFANHWLGFTVGGRLFEFWTEPEGVVARTVGDWPEGTAPQVQSVKPREKFIGYMLTYTGGWSKERTLGATGSVEWGRASVEYEPDGVRLAWDALQESPYGLSSRTRAYLGHARLSPSLPFVSVRARYWSVVALTMALPTLRAALALFRKWRRRVLPPGLCPACGYDLRATPGRCPECGRGAPAPQESIATPPAAR